MAINRERIVRCSSLFSLSVLATCVATASAADIKVGAPAPDFSVVDSQGGSRHLSEFRGKQGYVNGAAADDLTRSRHATPTAVLLDSSGSVGRLYDAKTTPPMYVIDKSGVLQYMGGIDSIATADTADIAKAEPYLKEALLAVSDGKPVAHSATKPYGCSIKY